MALDTKYRPEKYTDVLGQEASVSVLRQFVKEGRGFHQSYVFCGQHGSGKTTLGRILARALLCTNPQEGDPCDECHSCRTFLEGGTHESFEELDAATKSGKADLARIVEDVTYSTFSGNRRIYLFDESHRLSKQALDALLKPMEDNVEGSEDKKLVCIFCTTEPEKMRNTIFSRCAPAFVIRAVTPEIIAERLAWVCGEEGVDYDLDALVTIAEVGECHIRDALKTVEGVSMLGKITRDTVSEYLQLGANTAALDLVLCLGSDLTQAVAIASKMAMDVSPSAAYERVSEAALCAFRAHLGVGKIPSHWGVDKVQEAAKKGEALLGIASRFSAPPHRPNRSTFVLDVSVTHHSLAGGVPLTSGQNIVVQVASSVGQDPVAPAPASPLPPPRPDSTPSRNTAVPTTSPNLAGTPTPEAAGAQEVGGVWIDPKGIGGGSTASTNGPSGLGPDLFKHLLRHHLERLGAAERLQR